MNMQPTRDRIVVKLHPKEEKTSSGFFIVDDQKETTATADVIAAGPGSKTKDGVLVPTTVKPGDKVLFSKSIGHKVKVDGEELVILSEEEILAILE